MRLGALPDTCRTEQCSRVIATGCGELAMLPELKILGFDKGNGLIGLHIVLITFVEVLNLHADENGENSLYYR